jgi:hypothetical protein
MGMSSPDRICRTCGRQLGPYETFCSNCGAQYIESPYAPPPSSPGLTPPYAAGSPSPYDPTQRAAPYQDPYASPASATPAPGQYSMPGLSPYGSPPATQYGGYGAPYGGGGVSPLPPVVPQPPKKGAPVGLIVLVLVLVLVVVGAGIFYVARGGRTAGNGGNGNATPGPSVAPTAPTPVPLFSDNFADNSKGWDTTGGSGFSKTIANHALTMTDRNHRILVAPLPVQRSFSDFQITATMMLQSGDGNDSMGIYMRGDDQLNNDYRVDIFGDGTYAISKEVTGADGNTQVKVLSGISANSAIRPLGRQNQITVTIKGDQIVLQVNGQRIAGVTDSSYSSGMIALFVRNGTTSSGATGAITSVAVYPAPAQLP